MGKIRTRKRGKTYSYVFEGGKTPEGKRKVVEKGGFETAAAAYDAGVAAYNDYKNGSIEITGENMRLKDYLAKWLETVSPELRSNTIINYRGSMKRITPALAQKKIKEIRPRDIDMLYRELANSGYSLGSIRVTGQLLHAAFRYAVYPAEILRSNPVDSVRLPRTAPKKVVERKIITAEMLAKLLAKYPYNTRYYIPILLMYHTGMRINETLGLIWDNVDLNDGIIHVCQQLHYTGADSLQLAPVKTDSSVRDIMIDSMLVDTLRRWKLTQAENEKNYSDSYIYAYADENNHLRQMSKCIHAKNFIQQINFVCTTQKGQLVSYHSLAVALNRVGINAHSFRHTHATMLIENNANPKGVAERLGHKNVNITENLYTHATQKMAQDTLTTFEKSIKKVQTSS